LREVLFGKLDCKKQSIRKNSLVVIERNVEELSQNKYLCLCPRILLLASEGRFATLSSLLLPNAKGGKMKAHRKSETVFEVLE